MINSYVPENIITKTISFYEKSFSENLIKEPKNQRYQILVSLIFFMIF